MTTLLLLMTLAGRLSDRGLPTAQLAGAPQTAPRLQLALELHVQLGAPLELGEVAHGRRRIVPIVGGTFAGPGLKGKVLSGGADWQIIRADGFTEIDTRYTLETDTGQRIYVQNAGMRHAPEDVAAKILAGQEVDQSLIYMRTVPTFETSAPELQWLTRSIFIATGERHPTEAVIRVWRVE
jgi:hypothetical protein